MATTSIPIINILTYKLDYELGRQIYNEYQSRFKEATYLIDNYKTYKPLKYDMKAVELLLSLSIFHKRVIANLDAAVKFYGTVNTIGKANAIKMGSYSLDGNEKNKILGITMNYTRLMEEFSIPSTIMDYTETKDFLRKIIALKENWQYIQENEENEKKDNEGETEIPF